jgi:hypothetical protein
MNISGLIYGLYVKSPGVLLFLVVFVSLLIFSQEKPDMIVHKNMSCPDILQKILSA